MNPPPSPLGPEIDALAGLTGLDPESVALQAAAVLGGLAGPYGGLIGFGGEIHPVRFHLVVTRPETERHARLLALLTEPARLTQEALRHHRASLNPAVSRTMTSQFGFPLRPHRIRRGTEEDHIRDEEIYQEAIRAWHSVRQRVRASCTCQLHVDPWKNHRSGRRWDPDSGFGHEDPELTPTDLERVHHPNLITNLSGATAPSIHRLLGQADQQWLLGLDREGGFLGPLLDGGATKGDRAILDLLGGVDLPFPGPQGAPKEGVIRRAVLTFISIAGPQGPTGWARSAGNPPGGIPPWPHGTLLWGADPAPGSPPAPPPLEPGEADRHHRQFREAVGRVLEERRHPGTFHELAVRPEEAVRLRDALEGFLGRLEAVDEPLRPFCRGLAHLPAAILFGLKTLTPRDQTRELVEASCELAHRALLGHLAQLAAWMGASRDEDLAQRKEAMILKLTRMSPCTQRDLYRSYPVQRKDLHEPVLQSLIAEGLVERSRDGILRPSLRATALRDRVN